MPVMRAVKPVTFGAMATPGADRVWRSVQRAFTDPRLVGAVQAFPRTARFAVKARGADSPVRPSAGLVAQVLLDEILISVMRNPKLFPRGDDYANAARNIRAAYQMWEQRGWLDDPAGYHATPEVPSPASIISVGHIAEPYERFGSMRRIFSYAAAARAG